MTVSPLLSLCKRDDFILFTSTFSPQSEMADSTLNPEDTTPSDTTAAVSSSSTNTGPFLSLHLLSLSPSTRLMTREGISDQLDDRPRHQKRTRAAMDPGTPKVSEQTPVLPSLILSPKLDYGDKY